jgi:hypothetical protein
MTANQHVPPSAPIHPEGRCRLGERGEWIVGFRPMTGAVPLNRCRSCQIVSMQRANGSHDQEGVQRTNEGLMQKRDEAAKSCRIDPGDTATLA